MYTNSTNYGKFQTTSSECHYICTQTSCSSSVNDSCFSCWKSVMVCNESLPMVCFELPLSCMEPAKAAHYLIMYAQKQLKADVC